MEGDLLGPLAGDPVDRLPELDRLRAARGSGPSGPGRPRGRAGPGEGAATSVPALESGASGSLRLRRRRRERDAPERRASERSPVRRHRTESRRATSAVVPMFKLDTYVSICLHYACDGDRAQGDRRAAPPADPHARSRRGALGGRDRVALRGVAARGLPAPDRLEGGRARGRTTQRHQAPLPRPSRGARRAEGVPRRVLGRAARGAQARGRTRGEEEAWKATTERLEVRREIEIAASPETVWELLVDPEKAPTWWGQAVDVRPAAGRRRSGSR